MKPFKIYEDYLKQHAARSEKLGAYQEAVETARHEAVKAKQQYEYFFTESIKSGKDDPARIAELDEKVDATQKALAKAERDHNLAHASLPDVEISSVDVAREFRDVYVPAVRQEIVPGIEAKLKLARDLILSAIEDGRAADIEYREITDAIKEVAKSNHQQGKTQYHEMVGHPTSEARVFGVQGGVTSAARKVLEDVSKFTFGSVPPDYEYVAKAPATTTKGAK